MKEYTKIQYIIKIYDGDMKFITKLSESDLLTYINFSKTINSGYGELKIELNYKLNNFFEGYSEDDTFVIRIFIMGEGIDEQHVYTGISDGYDRVVEGKTNTLLLYAIGIQSVFFNTIVYDYTTDTKEPEVLLNGLSGDIISDYVIDRVGMQYIDVNNVVNITLGDTFISNTGATGKVIYKNEVYNYIGIGVIDIHGDISQKISVGNILTIGGNNYTINSFHYGFGNELGGLIGLSKGNIATGEVMNFEIKNKNIGELLGDIITRNNKYFYNIRDDLTLQYDLISTNNPKTLIMDREISKLIIESDKKIINLVRIENKDLGLVVESYDETSIEKNKVIIEKSLQDTDSKDLNTLQQRANSFIKKYREEEKQIKIEIPLGKLISQREVSVLWGDEDVDFNESITYGGAVKIEYDLLNIDIGDIVNIRNVDYKDKFSNLLVVKKVYDQNKLTIFLNRYKNTWGDIVGNTEKLI